MSAQTKTSSTHPLIPPTTEDERAAWLRLLRSRRVGISTFYRLMAEHGSADAALEALPEIATQAGLSKYQPCSKAQADSELARGTQLGAQLICRGEPHYPKHLAEISDAPPMIWVRGSVEALTRPMIALVGARNASSLGTRMARALAADLSEQGFVVVSGLARGIDTCAHLASVQGGTIAVLAGGVDIVYPAENLELTDKMMGHGALVSEQPIGMAPIARHFPMRNRIISGMSRGVVVVEAAAKSGSLITARDALDQGRDVLAVPGHPFDARAAGCNMLLRDGATLIRNADDVITALADLAPKPPEPEIEQLPLPLIQEAKPQRSLQDTHALHQRILDRLGPSPIAEDQLLRDIGAQASSTIPVLTDLEIRGHIRRAPGGLISRA